jgi:hypothetical protein
MRSTSSSGRRRLAVWALAVGGTLLLASPTQAAISGQLNDTQGAPVSNGLVRVYPDGEAALEGGNIGPIGTALADSSGHFDVTLTSQGQSMLQQQAAVNGGIANVEIAADNGGDMAGMTSVEIPVGSSGAARAAAADPTPVVVTMEAESVATANHNWSCPTPGTIRKDVLRRFRRWVQVGEANMAYGDSNATFSYGRTADSSVDVGYSAGGGVFSVGGTRHVGNSSGAAVSVSTAGQGQYKALTEFLFREGRGRWCDYRTHHHYQRFAIKAKRWIKTVSRDHQHNALNRCPKGPRYRFPRNTGFTRSHNHFESFHRGVSMDAGYRGWGITFHGGSRSGASSHADLHVSFGGGHSNHYACGENDKTVFQGKRTFSGGRT